MSVPNPQGKGSDTKVLVEFEKVAVDTYRITSGGKELPLVPSIRNISETSLWATFGTCCPFLATLRPSLHPLSTGSWRAMHWRSRSCSMKRSWRWSTSRRGIPRQSTSLMQARRSQSTSASTVSPHGSSRKRRASVSRAARLATACTS